MKKESLLLILIICATVSGNIFFWQYYYVTDLQSTHDSAYQSGNDVGYQLGSSDGNQSGYWLGYINGNVSGYGIGWDTGYNHGLVDGNETGFSYGYIQGVEDGAGRGYTLRDPTFVEALTFMSTDKTNENEYSENYNCVNFASDFKRNARQTKYRCGFVYIDFDEGAHSIVCFNTTENDLVLIEPQTDDIVNVTIGQPYWDRSKYEPPEYDDTVLRFIIIW